MALSYNFVQILGSGKLALSERPKLKEIGKLVSADCDLVVTILSAKGDQAHKIGAEVESCGMRWEWVKVTNANSMTGEEKLHFRSSIQSVYNAIKANEKVLLHCSAGLHRTGMFAYALLRKGCLKPEEALSVIEEIRKQTYEALEEKYINLAEKL